jgi:hypothetical protein
MHVSISVVQYKDITGEGLLLDRILLSGMMKQEKKENT